MLKLFVVCTTLCLISNCVGYELTLDTEDDIRHWKSDGLYRYAKNYDEIPVLLPDLENVLSRIEAPGNNSNPRIGYWLKNYTSKGDTKFNLQYRLMHHLFFQIWITFLASPSVPVIIKCNGKEVIRFWSNGNDWCDGVTNIFGSGIGIEAPEASNWIVLDRVVLGIMSNISHLDESKINPCLTGIRSHKIPDVVGKHEPENQGRTGSESKSVYQG